MVRFDEKANREGRQYIEDRRGQRSSSGTRGRAAAGGGLPIGKGGLGGVIIALLVALLGGGSLLGGGATSSPALDVAPPLGSGQAAEAEDETVVFMGALMDDIQDTWARKFEEAGRNYEFTTLVVFEGSVSTGCGNATSAVGPFYCPAPGDNRVYIDLGFWDQLAGPQFQAGGDFAQAYVVAHEIGHHIQSVTGISDSVRQIQAQNPGAKNELSVRQELQADCLAGVWANDASQRRNSDGTRIIETGDIEEGLRAAAAVGDDRIQSQAGMRVDTHTWTHGSSAARQFWFMEGFNTGDPEVCDTFASTVSRADIGL